MSKLDKLKTLIPLDQLEWSAQEQIYDNLAHDFLKVLAIMPDCHMGYLLPIGGAALLDGVVSPEYVGYDIGCGMCCVITDIDAKDLSINDRLKLFSSIYDTIPTGVGCERPISLDWHTFKSACGDKNLDKEVHKKVYSQLGTLGSGNHFIEIGKSWEGKIAVVIHSGSRKTGHTIAGYYMKLTKTESRDLPKGFLRADSDLGKAYVEDMNFCLQYALQNRLIMMKDVLRLLGINLKQIDSLLTFMINENHNHMVVRHDGYLHRKGATPAEKDVLGVIPGTMKSGTIITRGLGNEEYLSSASHGAGRKMSRTKAKQCITLEQHKKWMKGVIAKVDKSTLDEAHGAYKDLKKVVDMQEGIVIDIVDKIHPIINVKG